MGLGYRQTRKVGSQTLKHWGQSSVRHEAMGPHALDTVRSLMLSNTSTASCSALKDKVVVSNVRLWIVMGDFPSRVSGMRVTSAISGYGIWERCEDQAMGQKS